MQYVGFVVIRIMWQRFVRDETGATAIEYGLIASIISLLVIGFGKTVAINLSGTFNRVSGNLT
jgi:pilus assembly protein Flp/PilA